MAYCIVYGETCGSALRAQRITLRLFLVGEVLVYSIPIDAIEVLRERVENAATTIRNKRYAGKNGKIISSAPSLLQ
jgi:hypothetical protein